MDAVRKKIVATTEGGAITGEERLREHTDKLYGAILSYEGKPADYQMANHDALKREFDDVTKEFEEVLTKDLPALNDALKGAGKEAIPAPPAKVAVEENDTGSSSFSRAGAAIQIRGSAKLSCRRTFVYSTDSIRLCSADYSQNRAPAFPRRRGGSQGLALLIIEGVGSGFLPTQYG